MKRQSFADEIAHLEKAISAARLRSFGAPHLIVDNFLPDEFVKRINDNWPEANSFEEEVPGNFIARLFRGEYDHMPAKSREFWADFNEILWPALLAACAKAVEAPALDLFGDLYKNFLGLDGGWPLTLMQTSPTYLGHPPHTHFYHAPHWAFTVLAYVDPDDCLSNGTDIQRLRPRNDGNRHNDISSYQTADLDWRVEAAMSTSTWYRRDASLKWEDMPFEGREVNYRANRLFLLMDGPLAVHSVSFDRDYRPLNPERVDRGSTKGRRRILRSHVKVHETPFFQKHSKLLSQNLEFSRFMRVMAPNIVLSPEDVIYREEVVRPFYRERLTAYARAAQIAADNGNAIASAAEPRGLRKFWNDLLGKRANDEYRSQLEQRVPIKGIGWSLPQG